MDSFVSLSHLIYFCNAKITVQKRKITMDIKILENSKKQEERQDQL